MLLVRGDSLISSEQGDPVHINGVEWQLGQQLGEGTSSTVYSASYGDETTTRAVKVTQLQLLGSRERAALDEERALWEQLRHPHIIALEGHTTTAARHCMLLELAREELFSRVTRMAVFEEAEAARWTAQLLSALEYLHSLGWAHCDVKPENILLVESASGPIAKLSDFGSACRVA